MLHPRSVDALRIGIDARCLNTSHPRGMGKYVSEMLSHAAGDTHWHLFGDRPECPFHKPPGIEASVELFDFKGYRFHTWEQFALPLRARRRSVDLLHCTATTLPFWQPVPTVVTVHDTLPWRESCKDAYQSWYLRSLMPAALDRSAAVITISANSRNDILALWPRLENKLYTIPHGVGDAYFRQDTGPLSPTLASLLGTHPYLLYVGGALERKRFAWAVDVVRKLDLSELQLVACGFDERERSDFAAALDPAMRERVRFMPFVGESEMPALYSHSVAVLYPTLYEGFGLPALEAQSVGAPVLMSALGSLNELVGPSSEVLPTNDIDAWVQTVRRILGERRKTAQPHQAARTWARRYSWTTCADRHLDVYRSARRSGPPRKTP